jgi:hypothetical protein
MASRKNKTKLSGTTWLVIGLVAAMLIALAVVLFTPKEDYTYNAFPITKAACEGTDVDCYYVEFAIRGAPYTISFYNHPSEVEDIIVTPNALRVLLNMQDVRNHTVYIAVPTDAPAEFGIAGVALARILGTRYGIMNLNVKGAVLGNGPGEVSCSDASGRVLVIAMQEAAVDAVSVPQANCILLSATTPQMGVAVSEALTYRVLGVIPTFGRAPEATNSTA